MNGSNHKTGVMVGVIAALVLVVTLGVTFAIYNYSKVGENQILVAGDIYMKYTGTNQINAPDMLPIDINKYYGGYIVNPNMTEEELSGCESYFNEFRGGTMLQEGETTSTFCNGTGTLSGMTFQEVLDMESDAFNNSELEELRSRNIIKQEYIPRPVKYKYTRNASMTPAELSSCESFFSQEEFDEGSDARSFCEGTGIQDSMTFQGLLDSAPNAEAIEQAFSELIKNNVIKKEIAKEYPAIPYFEFIVEGVNNYSKDIWYEIVLKDGEPPADEPKRTERLRDDLLRFRLVEVVGGAEQEIFTNRGYEDLSDETIYVSTINANTTEKITRTYRIYMWISDSVKVGVGDNIDYDMETWNDKVYASVKINVAGDFNEKEVNYTPLPQPASCFETQQFDNKGTTEIMIIDYDRSCGRDVVIPSKINGHEVTVIGNGVGFNEDYIMPIGYIADKSFARKNLTSIVIPNTVRTIGRWAFYDNNLTKVEIPDSVTWIDENAFEGNPLEEVKVGSGIEYIGVIAFAVTSSSEGSSNFQRLEVKKTCDEIKNIPDKQNQKQYPWTNALHKEGLKVYGYEEGQLKLCDTIIQSGGK